MVIPENGLNYDSFIYGQYFGSTITGKTAATETTKEVISLIDEIPDRITLDADVIAKVEAARKAYDAMNDITQKSLVNNYNKLTGAETDIERLRANQSSSTGGGESSGEKKEGSPVALFIVLGVVFLACAAATVILVMKNKKNNK